MTTPAEDPRGGMGRHRAPPPPAKPPDRFIAPIAVAAVLLTAASLIAIYAPGIAPDATAAGRHGLSVSAAVRSARTVHVPLTVLPVPVPSIGAEGAWDPEATPSAPREARPTFRGVSTVASAPVVTVTGLSAAPSPIEATPDSPHATETPDTTPTSPAETAAATSEEPASSETTEETPVTAEPTADPTPTDVLEEIVDEAVGEGA